MCALNYCQVLQNVQGPLVTYNLGMMFPTLQQVLVQVPAVQAFDREALLKETEKAINFHVFNIQQKMRPSQGVLINVLVDRFGRDPVVTDVRIEVLGSGPDPAAAFGLSRLSLVRLVRTPTTVEVLVWVRAV